VTPNHDGTDTDEHFLRPKNTTQIITDDLGASWRYTINNDRELTLFDPPGNAASISYTYDSNHRVTSVTNADGVWTYAYTSPGDYGTTTVTNPLGEQIYVKYHRDRGYVTEARDGNYRTTLYEYDSGHRLTKVTFPELNYLQYVYDARGNITSETAMPKPGQGAPIVRTANFPATCTDQVLCNLPTWTRDGKGNQTDFEYAPTTTVSVQTHGTPISVASGTRKPVRILLPADANGIRPEIRNVYESGTLTRSAACRTTASCVGTADEVVTDYDYAGTAGHLRRLNGVAVTSEGVTLRTCYGYDQLSRLISETPPNAEVASCPSSLATALASNAVVPTAAHPASPPTYPDGTTGGSPPAGGGGGGGDPGEPVEECMRPGSTVECQ
jgi:YD repeat-containing protein